MIQSKIIIYEKPSPITYKLSMITIVKAKNSCVRRCEIIAESLAVQSDMSHQQQNLNPVDKTPEELLAEIRSLLSIQQPDQGVRRHLSPSEIEEMLRESQESSQILRKMPSLKAATQQKAQEALRMQQGKHSPFVQTYTRQKIHSEMFTPLRNNIPPQEQDYYQRQRQQLLIQRQAEQQEERQRQQQAIKATKKFLAYESASLPISDINEFTQKEGSSSRTYLLNQPPEKALPSVNNAVDDAQATDPEAMFQLMKQQSGGKQLHSHSQLEDEVIEVVEQQQMNQSKIRQEGERKLQMALRNSPNLVRVMRQLLIRQVTLQRLLNEEGSSKYRSSLNRSDSNFKYKNQPIILSKRLPEPQPQSVASLTRKYRSKGIVLKEMGGQESVRSMKAVAVKVISKMVGSSTEFHPKRAVLTQNELAWCDEKEQLNEESKRIELTLQPIIVQRKTKEEGSFFSKKSTEIDVVVLGGANRSLIFEKNYLEGADLYEELCNLMAQKIYRFNVLIACKTNQLLSDFIFNRKAVCFDLSNQFLQPHEKYPSRDYRVMMVSILVALFPFRHEITRFNCLRSRTNVQENIMLLRAMKFSKVQEICFSETKLNGQCLNILALYAASLSKLTLTLCNCLLDDNALLAAKEALLKCTSIQKLDISQNCFTLQGFSTVLELTTLQRSQLTQLNISDNMITNFAVIGQLIRKSRLEVLIAENCGLNFEYEEELRHFFQNCRNAKIRKLSLLRNDILNSLKNIEDFWLADTPKEISIDLGIYTEKTSKNLQGRLISSATSP